MNKILNFISKMPKWQLISIAGVAGATIFVGSLIIANAMFTDNVVVVEENKNDFPTKIVEEIENEDGTKTIIAIDEAGNEVVTIVDSSGNIVEDNNNEPATPAKDEGHVDFSFEADRDSGYHPSSSCIKTKTQAKGRKTNDTYLIDAVNIVATPTSGGTVTTSITGDNLWRIRDGYLLRASACGLQSDMDYVISLDVKMKGAATHTINSSFSSYTMKETPNLTKPTVTRTPTTITFTNFSYSDPNNVLSGFEPIVYLSLVPGYNENKKMVNGVQFDGLDPTGSYAYYIIFEDGLGNVGGDVELGYGVKCSYSCQIDMALIPPAFLANEVSTIKRTKYNNN